MGPRRTNLRLRVTFHVSRILFYVVFHLDRLKLVAARKGQRLAYGATHHDHLIKVRRLHDRQQNLLPFAVRQLKQPFPMVGHNVFVQQPHLVGVPVGGNFGALPDVTLDRLLRPPMPTNDIRVLGREENEIPPTSPLPLPVKVTVVPGGHGSEKGNGVQHAFWGSVISTWTKLNLYFSPQLFGPQSVTSVV